MDEQRQKELVRDRFTRTAEVFGDYAVAERAREAELLASLLDLRGDELGTDLACGPGTLALRFARHVRWICGVDLTPGIIERAQRLAAAERTGNLDFAIGDAHALPFGDGALDFAVTSYSLHHMADARRVVREMARVVKPGGRVGVIDIRAPEDRKVAALGNRIERLRDPSHTQSLSRGEFESVFAANGLRIRSIQMEEHPRSFDHWLRVAGWKRGDSAYEETRRVMESTIEDDGAGFHPRYAPGEGMDRGALDINIVNTVFLIAAEKG